MSSEYPQASIGSVAKVRSGFAFKSSDWQTAGIPVVKIANVKEGRLEMDGCSFVSEAIAQQASDFLLEKGDILISMTGYVGDVARVRETDTPCAVNQRVGRFHSYDKDLIDPSFLFFSLRSRDVRIEIEQKAYGSAQPNISAGGIEGISIYLPELGVQRSIAHILGTLDDKIELNRKTNKTLEAMAKALFKSWFVEFDPVRAKIEGRPTGLPAEISDLFPDSFEDSELGEIPSGWQCCSFTQLVEVISGGTPKTSIDEYWSGSIPWFSVVDAPSGSDCWVIQTEKSITLQGLDNCSSKLLSARTTIISARGTVGKVCLTGQDIAMNQSCYGLKSKAENGEYFCFYLTKSIVEILEARAHGSVFSTITRDTLDGVATISPSLEMIQTFNGITGALLSKIKKNLEENLILGNQRDALLPKLISGEIRIPDAEQMLEEVGIS